MILTGNEIKNEVLAGRITIDPFDPRLLNPNSYNILLGETLAQYADDAILDTRIRTPTQKTAIPPEGFVLKPDTLYLGHTVERIGSSHFVPFIGGRSSTGRLGLFIHITAPLGDIGYVGEWTLQLRPTVPVRVYAHQQIGQMFFVMPYGPVTQYKGKYQGGAGPQAFQPGELHPDRLPQAPLDPYSAMCEVLNATTTRVKCRLDEEAIETARRLVALAPGRPLIALDVGCGVGILLNAFEQTPRICEIVGIDSSSAVLSAAARRLRRTLLIRDDFMTFDFSKKHFDIVALLAFLHLFPKRHVSLILSRARELLSDNGILVASTTIHNVATENWEEKGSIPGAWRFRSRYTLDEWRNVFASEWTTLSEWTAEEVMSPEAGRHWHYIAVRPAAA